MLEICVETAQRGVGKIIKSQPNELNRKRLTRRDEKNVAEFVSIGVCQWLYIKYNLDTFVRASFKFFCKYAECSRMATAMNIILCMKIVISSKVILQYKNQIELKF